MPDVAGGSDSRHASSTGKTGKQNKSNKGPKQVPGPIEPELVRPTEPLKPLRLATTATKPKNEPMFNDIDMMGFPGVSPYRRENGFSITAEGFIPLVEKEYDVIASVQPFFAKTVPKSSFVYYCVEHLIARLVTLKRDRGESTYVEDAFMNQVLSGNHHLPGPIDQFIKGIGNVVDPDALRYNIDFPAWPGLTGDFGRVGPETHWMYMSLPSPRVCAQRVKEDLRASREPNVQRDWQLPVELVPEEQAAGVPTRNLLGWAKAAPLTNDQVAFLESVNITPEDFPSRFPQFAFNAELFEKVSLSVDRVAEKFKLVTQTPASTSGSNAQVCWSEVEPTQPSTSRHGFYLETRNSRIVTASDTEARTTLASLICGYRVRKTETQNLRPYCVYDFEDYAAVPNTWHQTCNHIFEFGRAGRWNLMEFTSPYTDKSEYRLAWLKRHLK